ncbi:4'-phosphopantetheinyl transferase family protein [Streptomyces griseiscabiei]|uniref:4'-phosphopantetheinyl transferase superfamily protein n=1 Tax=Streptomyces griseiscabiei TaxID=2993540 RepID=A0ABU4LEH5_9ACTN|nr:4'-phosphopantetheinyl transferase superfamily protein [Streptomyces griseiscabiei]MBZ3906736.1 4'-phosphopantetheinyl transferase superfamily protein [Streptomyces griseiscabiei]MDX2913801.1 4'-phosphopantetheinyl transferase superfamily protein [Streptomyces griseiscabiei]
MSGAASDRPRPDEPEPEPKPEPKPEPEPEVDVWTVPLDGSPATVAALAGLLSPCEAERGGRCRFAADRRRFVVAHAALRLILADRLDVPPEEVRLRRGRHGKPRLAGGSDLRFNLSHSGDLALVAVTRYDEVGVDVDRLRPGLPVEPLAERFFPASEARFVAEAAGPTERAGRFLRLWTRKEAVVKAAGGRLVQGLGLAVCGADGVVRDPSGQLRGAWSVLDLPVPDGHRAALAVAGPTAPRISVRRADPGRAR